MKILAVRFDDGLLFIDMQTKGRFGGEIEVTYELNPKYGGVINDAWIDGKPVKREPTQEERKALSAAFQIYYRSGEMEPSRFPVNVTFEDQPERVIDGHTIPAGVCTCLDKV